jgi:hypothetical protein
LAGLLAEGVNIIIRLPSDLVLNAPKLLQEGFDFMETSRKEQASLVFHLTQVGRERPLFGITAYSENAETNNVSVRVHALHDCIVGRGGHISRSFGEADFKIIALGIEQYFFLAAISLLLVRLAEAVIYSLCCRVFF